MESIPIIETSRLRLRMPAAADIPDIVRYANNPKITANTLNIPYPYEEKDGADWVEKAHKSFEDRSDYVFAICLISDDKFIGATGLHLNKRFNHAELGYWIAEPFWNKGYVTEAAGEMLKFGFETLELQKIFAIHIIQNPASGKIMTKNGMIKEGELKDHLKKNDQYLSVHQYRLTKEEYFNLK